MAAPFSPDVLTVRDTETVWYEQCVTRYGAVLDLQCRRTDVVHHFKSTGIITSRLTGCYDGCAFLARRAHNLQCRRTDVVHHFKSTGIHYLSPNWLLRWLRRSRQTCSQ
ncbi:hypothetical protein J6590_035880 [Homalodisca vitripennis]|nr:hypothetical protein J6590_035880 [Homalodisca vitripennis]